MNNSARAELFPEFGVFGVVGVLRLLLSVEVIEVAEEFIEPVVGGQELVLVAEMVLAELASHVAKRLEQLGDGRILLTDDRGRHQAGRPCSDLCGTEAGR